MFANHLQNEDSLPGRFIGHSIISISHPLFAISVVAESPFLAETNQTRQSLLPSSSLDCVSRSINAYHEPEKTQTHPNRPRQRYHGLHTTNSIVFLIHFLSFSYSTIPGQKRGSAATAPSAFLPSIAPFLHSVRDAVSPLRHP